LAWNGRLGCCVFLGRGNRHGRSVDDACALANALLCQLRKSGKDGDEENEYCRALPGLWRAGVRKPPEKSGNRARLFSGGLTHPGSPVTSLFFLLCQLLQVHRELLLVDLAILVGVDGIE